MKVRNVLVCMLSLVVSFGLLACGNTKTDRALSGGAIGAGVGAVGSSVTGGSPWTGAVIGGAAGAATGALTSKKQIDLGR